MLIEYKYSSILVYTTVDNSQLLSNCQRVQTCGWRVSCRVGLWCISELQHFFILFMKVIITNMDDVIKNYNIKVIYNTNKKTAPDSRVEITSFT